MASETSHNKPRILIVGLGSIGGILAAYLLRSGHRVDIAAKDNSVAANARQSGLRVSGFGPTIEIEPTFAPNPLPGDAYDYIIFCVQPDRLAQAAAAAQNALRAGGAFVVCQNGLSEPRLQAATKHPVIGCVVGFGGRWNSDGSGFIRTSPGGFTVGWWNDAAQNGSPANQADRTNASPEELAEILESVGPVKISSNLPGARWSKLAINAAISPLGTIYGRELGALLGHRFCRRMALECMTETVGVAQRENIKLEKVAGTLNLDWMALSQAELQRPWHPNLWLKHAVLYLIGLKFRKMRSSMLRDLEAGRLPPVDFINGEIISRGKTYGIDTPVNQALAATVKDIHAGQKEFGLNALRATYQASRSGRA